MLAKKPLGGHSLFDLSGRDAGGARRIEGKNPARLEDDRSVADASSVGILQPDLDRLATTRLARNTRRQVDGQALGLVFERVAESAHPPEGLLDHLRQSLIGLGALHPTLDQDEADDEEGPTPSFAFTSPPEPVDHGVALAFEFLEHLVEAHLFGRLENFLAILRLAGEEQLFRPLADQAMRDWVGIRERELYQNLVDRRHREPPWFVNERAKVPSLGFSKLALIYHILAFLSSCQV